MSKYTLAIALFSFIASLTGCFSYLQSNSQMATAPPDDPTVLSPALIAPKSSPPSQPTRIQTLQPTSTVSVSLTTDPVIAPDIPSVTHKVYLGERVVDALADSVTGYLYVMTASGDLRILKLADGKEVSRLETSFEAAPDRQYSGQLLSIDSTRNRLYVRGDQIFIVNTISLTITDYLNFDGQITPDPTSNRAYLTSSNDDVECGTQILDVETWEKVGVIYPTGLTEPPPPMGPCIAFTLLDAENQILYASGSICSGGSTCGSVTNSIFDVANTPHYIANIPGQAIAIDSLNNRIFAAYRESDPPDFPHLNRFEIQGQTITRTISLLGLSISKQIFIGGQNQIFYDSNYDRLYGETAIFDGDLGLLARTDLPGSLLAFDPIGQRLYSGDEDGNLFIISTSGGKRQIPDLAKPASNKFKSLDSLITADARQFRIYKGRDYLAERRGGIIAASPNYEQDRILLANPPYGNSGGDGLYRSIDGGETWVPITHGLTSFQIAEIIFSPTFTHDKTIFLTTEERLSGSPDDELFRSTDGGNTWVNLSENLAHDGYVSYIGRPASSPTFVDDKLVFISLNGILFRSTNGGNTWTDTGVLGNLVAFSPNFAKDKLIISSNKSRSVDGGQTWQPLNDEPDTSYFQEILFSPDFASDQTIYMLLQPQQFNSKFNLQRSTDAGRNWQTLVSELPSGFDYTHSIILSNGDLYVNADDGQDLTLDLASLSWDSVIEE